MVAAMSSPLLALLLVFPAQEPGPDFEAGFASITEKDLLVHATELASPQLEGRDSPSEGLRRAGDYIVGRLKAAGVESGMPDGSYRMGYTVEKEAPVAEECLLAMTPEKGEEVTFVLGQDFVPLPGCAGEGEGKLSFFGLDRKCTRLNSSHLGISYAVFCL